MSKVSPISDAPREAKSSPEPLALTAEESARLTDRLPYLAWRWYRIRSDVAEDIAQAALLTYIEVKDRYPKPEEHRVILIGIFRNKCREHIAKDVRATKGIRSLRDAVRNGGAEGVVCSGDSTPEEGVLYDLVHREDGRAILAAISELKPAAREILRLIVEEGCSRQELSKRYQVNLNTLDSRLRSARQELRGILSQRGVQV